MPAAHNVAARAPCKHNSHSAERVVIDNINCDRRKSGASRGTRSSAVAANAAAPIVVAFENAADAAAPAVVAGAAAAQAGAWIGLAEHTGASAKQRKLPAHRWRAEASRRGSQVSRLCVWRAEAHSASQMWRALAMRSRNRVTESVLKIVRVAQRDGRERFDVFVWASAGARVLESLVARGWHARAHTGFGERRKEKLPMQGEGGELAAAAVKVDVAQREQRARARASVRVATWNVRSLRSREAKDELADFVTRRNLGILALQETWRSASARALRVPGYQVFECPTTQDESKGLGVALLVARELPAALVRESPHALWVRVELVCADTPVFVACVYCPRGRARALLEQIGRQATEFMAKGAEVLIMGDFNTSADKAAKRLRRGGFAGGWARAWGSDATFHRAGRNQSSIDHVFASPLLLEHLSRACVLRQEDRSDHWPVMASVSTPATWREEALRARATRRQVVDLRAADAQAIAQHNRFALLADTDATEEAHLTSLWPQVMQQVLQEAGAVKERPMAPRVRRARLSKMAGQAVRARQRAFQQARHAATPAEADAAWRAYRSKRAEVGALVRAENERGVVAQMAGLLLVRQRLGTRRAYWAKLDEAFGRREGRLAAGIPIRDSTGAVKCRPTEALGVWHSHFSNLLGSAGGVAAPAAAQTRGGGGAGAGAGAGAGSAASSTGPLRGRGLGKPLTLDELSVALKAMDGGKAPGCDGVGADVLKLALSVQADQQPSPLALAMLRVCNAVFAGTAPTEGEPTWCEALLVPVPKKGDQREVDNYRGIGLMTPHTYADMRARTRHTHTHNTHTHRQTHTHTHRQTHAHTHRHTQTDTRPPNTDTDRHTHARTSTYTHPLTRTLARTHAQARTRACTRTHARTHAPGRAAWLSATASDGGDGRGNHHGK